ncbi:MAG: hypothetical protein WA615_10790 [Bradyrhizobium sp.]|uniref:hypothetical protein n=1 Tax=Bradyrhizobium sp. TaxID=376 RepID=UPI003C7CB8C4
MNNLTFAVIAIAVAQSLTILLTIGRDREIKKLREIVAQQRIFISEIKGWLLRERIELAQPRRKSDREPAADEIKAPEIHAAEIVPEIKAAPKILFGINAPKIKAPEIKVPEIKVAERTITPKDTAEHRLIKPDREPIADDMRVPEPAVTRMPEPAKTLNDSLATVQPHTAEDETKEDATKRLTKATNWLKEDADTAREIVAVLQEKPPGTEINE